MTLIGALSFGELAAAMPHAGGQYVYLRESLRPGLGLPLRLDDASRHPDRHDRSRRHRLRQIHGRDRAVVLGLAMDLEDSAPSVRGNCGSASSAPTTWDSIARTCSRFSPSSSLPGSIRAACALGKIVQNIFTVAKIGIARRLWCCSGWFFDRRRSRRELSRFLAQCRLVGDASVSAR